MLTQETFCQVTNLIYKYSGVKLEEKKKYLVEHRVTEHMRELGLSSLKDYVLELKLNPNCLRDLVS
ncbi:MAG TPA: hypothetical protein ENF30_01730, partial [Candidatus Desulfofervidus auxilii]|nr:hypothetical protein [Candidatus Desulfofervidus auxilii]